MAIPTQNIVYRIKLEGTDDELSKLRKINQEILNTKSNLSKEVSNSKKYAEEEQRLKALNQQKREIAKQNLANNRILNEEANTLGKLRLQQQLLNKQLDTRILNSKEYYATAKRIQVVEDQIRRSQADKGGTANFVGEYSKGLSGILKLGGLVNIVAQFSALYIALRKISQVVTYSIEQFKEFENTMKLVQAVTGATNAQINELTQSALKLGQTSIFSPQEIAKIQVEYSKMGFGIQQILNITQDTINIATATGSTLEEAANNLSYTLRQYRIASMNATHVTDVMAAAFNKSALDATTYGEAMKYVGGVASSLNISLEDTAAMLGVLANAGIRGSMAGTSLRRIMTDMSLKGKTLSEALTDLAARGINVTDAFDEVGRTAQTSLVILANNYPAVRKLSDEMKNSSGETQRMANVMKTSLQGQVTIATNQMKELGIVFAERFNPQLKESVSWWGKMVSKVSEWIRLSDVEKMVQENTEINYLVKNLQNTNIGYDEKILNWERLQQLAPDMLSDLDKESKSYEILNERLRVYNANTVARMSLAPAKKEIEDAQKEAADILTKLTQRKYEKAQGYADPGIDGDIKRLENSLSDANKKVDEAMDKYNDFVDLITKQYPSFRDKLLPQFVNNYFEEFKKNITDGTTTLDNYNKQIEETAKYYSNLYDFTFGSKFKSAVQELADEYWKSLIDVDLTKKRLSKEDREARKKELDDMKALFDLEIKRRIFLNDAMESTTASQKLKQKMDKVEIEYLQRKYELQYEINKSDDPNSDLNKKRRELIILAEIAYRKDVIRLQEEYSIKLIEEIKKGYNKEQIEQENKLQDEYNREYRHKMRMLELQKDYLQSQGNDYDTYWKNQVGFENIRYEQQKLTLNKELEDRKFSDDALVEYDKAWELNKTIHNNNLAQINKDYNDAEIMGKEQVFQATMNLSKNMVSLMYADAKYREELAWFNLAIDTASGISGGIATVSRSSSTWYEALVGYITIAASVVSAMATASNYMSSAPTYASGGIAGENGFPLDGGIIGGRYHSQGGTKFWLGGKMHEAEKDERHVIVKKGNSDWDLPILSAINQANGGRKFAYGGVAGQPSISDPFRYMSSSIDYDLLARGIARANQGMNIIVQVKDVVNGVDSYNKSVNNAKVW